MPNLKNRVEALGPIGHCAVTALLLGFGLLLAAPLAVGLYGNDGIWAASGAAALIFIAAAIGITFGALLAPSGPRKQGSKRNDVVTVAMFGMLVRMFLPLAVCLVIQMQGVNLARGGFIYFVLAFYLVTLAAETWLLVRKLAASTLGG